MFVFIIFLKSVIIRLIINNDLKWLGEIINEEYLQQCLISRLNEFKNMDNKYINYLFRVLIDFHFHD